MGCFVSATNCGSVDKAFNTSWFVENFKFLQQKTKSSCGQMLATEVKMLLEMLY